jgi:hypothetical protein
MDKPTHHDAELILKLYELRREERMRKARNWLGGYKAGTLAEHQAACPQGSEQDAYFRMVSSYWDMAASFVTSGALNQELFLQSGGELLFIWTKIGPLVQEMREAYNMRHYLGNMEKLAQISIDNMNKANPKAYEAFTARVRGVGA